MIIIINASALPISGSGRPPSDKVAAAAAGRRIMIIKFLALPGKSCRKRGRCAEANLAATVWAPAGAPSGAFKVSSCCSCRSQPAGEELAKGAHRKSRPIAAPNQNTQSAAGVRK